MSKRGLLTIQNSTLTMVVTIAALAVNALCSNPYHERPSLPPGIGHVEILWVRTSGDGETLVVRRIRRPVVADQKPLVNVRHMPYLIMPTQRMEEYQVVVKGPRSIPRVLWKKMIPMYSGTLGTMLEVKVWDAIYDGKNTAVLYGFMYRAQGEVVGSKYRPSVHVLDPRWSMKLLSISGEIASGKLSGRIGPGTLKAELRAPDGTDGHFEFSGKSWRQVPEKVATPLPTQRDGGLLGRQPFRIPKSWSQ